MLYNVGTKIRRVFFINGPNGPIDFFHGVVRSVTVANKYDTLSETTEALRTVVTFVTLLISRTEFLV